MGLASCIARETSSTVDLSVMDTHLYLNATSTICFLRLSWRVGLEIRWKLVCAEVAESVIAAKEDESLDDGKSGADREVDVPTASIKRVQIARSSSTTASSVTGESVTVADSEDGITWLFAKPMLSPK